MVNPDQTRVQDSSRKNTAGRGYVGASPRGIVTSLDFQLGAAAERFPMPDQGPASLQRTLVAAQGVSTQSVDSCNDRQSHPTVKFRMRLSLRFIVPLALALTAIAYAVVPLVDSLTLRWFVRDLDIRSSLIANTLQEPLEEMIRTGSQSRMLQFFTRITRDERLYAMGFCPLSPGEPLATTTFPTDVDCANLDAFSGPSGHILTSPHGPLLVSVRPVEVDEASAGSLVLLHDMSFAERRSEETRKYLFYFFVGLGAAVSLITVVIAQLSWRGWVHGLRALLRGEGIVRPSGKPDSAELKPIARELRALITEIEAEHQSRDHDRLAWTPEAVRAILLAELRGQAVIVVSNREPYIHVRQGDSIEVQRPASGVVTALEPIMRACSGTWIAHGSGSADRDVVDRDDRVAVPSERPAYQLRRVWLSAEEEAGYYYGFSNEGLWPLCHIAHVRPTFRTWDWEQYVKVNRRFADAVIRESRSPRSDRAGPGLPLGAVAQDDSGRRSRPPRSSRSGTFRGRIPRRSPFAPGERSCSTACSAAASSDFTRSFTATTSSIRSIDCSKRGPTGKCSACRTGAS